MSVKMCARCKERLAVIFVTRVEGDKTFNEGFCIKCAKQLGIKPVNDMIEKLGLSPEELEDKLMLIEYVSEVLVYEEDRKIVAEFFLNEDDYPDARNRIKDDVNEFNRRMPLFKNIGKVKVRDEEFPKTTTLKIARKYN